MHVPLFNRAITFFLQFVEDYEPTRADSYSQTIQVDGQDVRVDVMDTAGEEEYASVRDSLYRSGDGFLAVFAVTDRESLHAIEGFLYASR